MADFFGENATLRENTVPSEKIRTQEDHGRMRIAHDQITLSGAITTSDVIRLMKLPAGAKIYDAEINTDDLGTTGVFDVGWAASDEGNEAADPDGLYAALDVNAAANDRLKMVNSVAGFLKRFSEAVEIQIAPSTATTAGGDVKLTIWYVVD